MQASCALRPTKHNDDKELEGKVDIYYDGKGELDEIASLC